MIRAACALAVLLAGCAHVAPSTRDQERGCPRPVSLVLCFLASCRDVSAPVPAD